jgi:hypothetical protein
MKTATLTKAKNYAVLTEESIAPDDRVERLERQGFLHRAQAFKSPDLFQHPRPIASEGASVLETLLEERSGGDRSSLLSS